MMTEPIDLQAVAGKRHCVQRDPAQPADGKRADDPWLLVISCQRGHVYPHSATRLGIATDDRGPAAAIARLPGVTIEQDGDDGINATFPPSLFNRVARIVKPRRRRQLSAAQRERLNAAGTKTRLGVSPGVQSEFKGQIPIPMA
jgi:hypothetical protein